MGINEVGLEGDEGDVGNVGDPGTFVDVIVGVIKRRRCNNELFGSEINV